MQDTSATNDILNHKGVRIPLITFCSCTEIEPASTTVTWSFPNVGTIPPAPGHFIEKVSRFKKVNFPFFFVCSQTVSPKLSTGGISFSM